MMMYTSLLVLALIGSVSARCDNSCSGHGVCLFDDVCQCYDNYGIGMGHDSGDCSERICPYEIAWVDTPDVEGNFHKYAECAGKGVCDRASGQCQCFEGYEGKGCQRATCPNSCSGHGTCEYIEDLGFASPYHDSVTEKRAWLDSAEHPLGSMPTEYHGWDKHKHRGCVCDALYGDVDCSKRMCPYVTDVLDQRDNLLIADDYQVQQLVFVPYFDDSNAPLAAADGGAASLVGQTFALTFKSKLNETFTTIPIVFADVTAADEEADMFNDIKQALLHLPNKVIDGVSVRRGLVRTASGTESSVATTAAGWYSIDITFSGDSVQGPQNLLWVEAIECASGCTPKITGLDARTKATLADPSHTIEQQSSHFHSFECGRRGKCDYATGICKCFAGYSGDSCHTLTTLV